MEQTADDSPRWIKTKFDGKCKACGANIYAGDRVVWQPGESGVVCKPCVEEGNIEGNVPDDNRTDS